VLVAPPELAFDYVYTHYPVGWSFVPANRETLRLLTATHTVGTLVLPATSSDTALTASDVAGEGFRLVETAQVDQARYLVFRSARGPEPGR